MMKVSKSRKSFFVFETTPGLVVLLSAVTYQFASASYHHMVLAIEQRCDLGVDLLRDKQDTHVDGFFSLEVSTKVCIGIAVVVSHLATFLLRFTIVGFSLHIATVQLRIPGRLSNYLAPN